MIEWHYCYDFLPGIDQQAYGELAKRIVGVILQQPGIVEFRANRNILGSPQARATGVWQTFADVANFMENLWPTLESEFRTFVTNIRVEVWGPSPVVPQTLRPGK